jgi:propanol-preferring alcohol dehydrogenase
MKAFQFVELQKPAALRDVKVLEPGPGQVLIKIGGAGACHSDLHILETPAGTPGIRLPFTLGHENAGKGQAGGLGRDGGMANYMIVPSTRFLIPLGKLDPRETAPLTDAALTSYHAVKRSIHLLGPGSTAVVIGAGGLGQMAIQVLKALSAAATVIKVGTSSARLETAKQMGADEATDLRR